MQSGYSMNIRQCLAVTALLCCEPCVLSLQISDPPPTPPPLPVPLLLVWHGNRSDQAQLPRAEPLQLGQGSHLPLPASSSKVSQRSVPELCGACLPCLLCTAVVLPAVAAAQFCPGGIISELEEVYTERECCRVVRVLPLPTAGGSRCGY